MKQRKYHPTLDTIGLVVLMVSLASALMAWLFHRAADFFYYKPSTAAVFTRWENDCFGFAVVALGVYVTGLLTAHVIRLTLSRRQLRRLRLEALAEIQTMERWQRITHTNPDPGRLISRVKQLPL